MGNYVTSVDLPTITVLAHKRRVLSVVAGDAEQLAFASDSFDVVLASEVVSIYGIRTVSFTRLTESLGLRVI